MASSFFTLGADNGSESWRNIRSARANPPRQIQGQLSGDRKRVFHMALEQAQQQFEAASRIPYESRALNLFYGLNQAGRAICAASGELGGTAPESQRVWLPSGGHGLRFSTDVTDNQSVLSAPVKCQATKTDSFSRVSWSLGSPLGFGVVSFGNLIAQIPEVWLQFRELNWGPVPLIPNGLESRQWATSPVRWNIHAPGLDVMEIEDRDAIEKWKSRYPGLDDLRLALDNDGKPVTLSDPGWIALEATDATSFTIERHGYRFPTGARLYRRHHIIFPGVDDGKSLHPLATWWMVLFALSMLARYSPKSWGDLLSLEKSPLSTVIEFILDSALDAVPNLIAEHLAEVD